MKRVLLKFICLLSLSSIVILVSNYVLMEIGFIKSNLAYEVFYVNEKAGIANDCTVVYFGDSVTKQLWDPFDQDVDKICHMGCNQAMTPVGTYVVMDKYLKNNPQTEELYYIIRPQSLANDIWTDFSYQYFVEPLYNSENRKIIDLQTQQIIEGRFGTIFCKSELIKKFLLNDTLSMKIYLDVVQRNSEPNVTNRISNTAALYLRKMKELCDEHNVKFYVKPNPLLDTAENHLWDEYEKDIVQYGLSDILEGFIDNIVYYPGEWFSDKVHFPKEVLDEHGEEIRHAVMQ